MSSQVTSQSLQKAVINNSTCHFDAVIATNTNSSTRWLQLFNGTALPSASAVPVLELQVGGNTQGSINLLNSIGRLGLTKGLVLVSSSTSGTYTDSGAADFFVTVLWDLL